MALVFKKRRNNVKESSRGNRRNNTVEFNVGSTNTEEEVTTSETATTEETTAVSDEIVEIPWESVEDIFNFKQKLENLENYFSDMCLTFEKNKASLMAQIMYGQSDLYNMAQTLQKGFNVNTEITYELKLPQKKREKKDILFAKIKLD